MSAIPEPLRRSSRQTVTRTLSYAQSSASDASESPSTMSDSPPPVTPVAKRGTKRAHVLDDDEYGLKDLHTKVSPEDAPSDSDSPLSEADSDEVVSPSKRKRKSPKKNATAKTVPSVDVPMDGPSPVKKARKPRPPKPEPVYVIPDVEKKTTTFRGRLGYACLNTVLRNKKPADMSIFCSRTCRIETIKQKGLEWAKELGRQNVKDMIHLIEWNEKNNIRFMRMSSEMFPFASHPEYGYTLEYAQEELSAVGALANKYGHRLTTHPGQFTQLGSPRKEVVRNAVRDLKYHCEMIDRMGLGKDSIMIIHGGGVFGDKPATLARMKENYVKLLPDNVKARLVLENDEMCYSAEDLLPMCEELSIPLVFDYHHDWILPSSIGREEVIRRANAIFASKGIKPKQHLSEPRPGAVTVMERRAHSDRCQNLPDELPDDMDLMIEAKDKEQAVLHLYRIYDLCPVIHESLRPPADIETTQTKGRKSHKPAGTAKSPKAGKSTGTGRKKATKVGIVADEDEIKGEDPAVLAQDDGEGEGFEDPDAAGVELKAEEHAYVPQDGELVTPAKKKRAPRKKAVVKDEQEDVEMAGTSGKKKRGRKAAAVKAKVELVDSALAETSLPDKTEMELPVLLDAVKEEEAGPSPAKRRRVARTKKVEEVAMVVSEEIKEALVKTKATKRGGRKVQV